jgi:hypothetical protein
MLKASWQKPADAFSDLIGTVAVNAPLCYRALMMQPLKVTVPQPEAPSHWQLAVGELSLTGDNVKERMGFPSPACDGWEMYSYPCWFTEIWVNGKRRLIDCGNGSGL